MPVTRWDDEIDVVEGAVLAAGPLQVDPGENVLAVCVKILEDDKLLAECDPKEHPFELSPGRWSMRAVLVSNGPAPHEGPAVGVAVVVTSGPEPGQMTTYQWIDPIKLKAPQPSSAS